MTHISAKEDFVLRLIQYRHDDYCVGPWMGDIMQSPPEKRTMMLENLRQKRRETDCVGHGFLPVLSDDERRLVHDSFHPPQIEYTREPQEAQN